MPLDSQLQPAAVAETGEQLLQGTPGGHDIWSLVEYQGPSLPVSTISLRQNGDPSGALSTLPQFGSPSQVYGPRNIRFNLAFRLRSVPGRSPLGARSPRR